MPEFGDFGDESLKSQSPASLGTGDLERRVALVEQTLDTLSVKPAIQVEARHVEPEKPRDGMIVLADGTDWNPGGGGEGFYVYYNATWTKLLDALAPSLLTLDNDWSGTNTHTKRVNHAVHSETAHASTSDPWTGGNLCLYTGSAVTFTDIADAPEVGAVEIVLASIRTTSPTLQT